MRPRKLHPTTADHRREIDIRVLTTDNTNDYENSHRRNYRRAELRQRNHTHPDKPT